MSNFDLRLKNCLIGLDELESNSVDLCLTDPPYFLDGLGDDWDVEKIEQKMKNEKGTIKSLPAGMKFDPNQGKRFQEFYNEVSAKVFRVLKPGGFFLSFSAGRLYHRMTVAMEDQGFEIRDMLGWVYAHAQAKAFGLNHFIEKDKNISEDEKAKLMSQLEGWKTPQLKPAIEPIAFAQKPIEGTFLENWKKYGVGLINTELKLGSKEDKFPATILTTEMIEPEMDKVFLVPKPHKEEKGEFNNHISVKPLQLCEHLIKLVTQENAVVLDPFNGSGSTGIAAVRCNRNYVGFEVSQQYYDIAVKRYQNLPVNDDIFTSLFTM